MEYWKDPLNLFIWFIYALIVFSGISYSTIYLLKKNYKTEIKKKEDLEKMEREYLKKLLEKHIETQEYERNRIGSDLHDSISNKLSLILLKLNMEYKSEQIYEDIKETLLIVRDISHDLNPPFYKNSSLHTLIIDQFEKLSTKFMLQKSIKLHEIKDKSANFKIQVIRVVQELITNIIKHADATEIKLDIRESYSGIYISIADNGTGFKETKNGLGYQNIENRLFLIKGSYKIKSKANYGSKIVLFIQNET